MEIVNGYPCLNCSDVAKAKRNIDPAANPLQQAQTQDKRPSATLGVNQPLAAGVRGTQVNVLL
jgi:hypothetical protein